MAPFLFHQAVTNACKPHKKTVTFSLTSSLFSKKLPYPYLLSLILSPIVASPLFLSYYENMKEHTFIIDKCNRRSFFLWDSLLRSNRRVVEFGKTADVIGTPVYVFSPARKLTREDINSLIDGAVVFAGSCPERELLDEKGIVFVSLFAEEAYCRINSVITAEGALALAISDSDKALFASRVLVLGYGRLGKAVTELFVGSGATVAVATYDLGEYNLVGNGRTACYFKRDFVQDLYSFDIIINTIPFNILSPSDLEQIGAEQIYIELASSPYGFDRSSAISFRLLNAPSLPDKYSAKTAGEALRQCVERRLEQLGL